MSVMLLIFLFINLLALIGMGVQLHAIKDALITMTIAFQAHNSMAELERQVTNYEQRSRNPLV
jgi:hypothetical protein